tara:strand:- start:86 stop:4099 length:4014 start_codon:yes stop_codon:yes gene_type:complete
MADTNAGFNSLLDDFKNSKDTTNNDGFNSLLDDFKSNKKKPVDDGFNSLLNDFNSNDNKKDKVTTEEVVPADKLSPEYKEFLDNKKATEAYLKNKDKIDALIELTHQNELRVKRANQFPQYFTDGKLTDFKGAESAGIAYKTTIDVGGSPTAPNAGTIKFADEDMMIEREQLVPTGSYDKTFRSDVESIEDQMNKMLTIQDRDKIGERYTYRKPPRNVKVDYETYLLSDTFKERMKDSPYKNFYYETFGKNGAKTLAAISAGAMYVRGGTADLYKTIHESIDEGTDGGFTKLLGMTSKSGAKKFTGDLGQILEVAEIGAMMRIFTKIPKARVLAEDIFNAELKKNKKLIKAAGKVNKIQNRRLNINRAKNAEIIVAAEKAKNASLLAKENKAIKEELIIDYEVQIGARDSNDVSKILDKDKLISTTLNKKGKETGTLRIDYDKARIVGLKIADAEFKKSKGVIIDDDTLNLKGALTGQKEKILVPPEDFKSTLNLKADDLLGPILLPDKIDPLIAIASELRKNNPNLFQGKMTIDALLNATVKGDLIATDELLGLLNKYDLTLEEYITMVVGSASRAGQVLQKVAMIKGKKLGTALRSEVLDSKNIAKMGHWKQLGLRTIDIGRGALVSMWATMVRNVESTLIRAPMESLANVPNTMLYHLTNRGLKVSDFKGFAKTSNWRGVLSNSTYLFDNLDVRDYVDYLINRPEFANNFDALFTQISEIKRLKGPTIAPTNKAIRAADYLVTAGEDLVETLNIFNRWQDHVTRSTYFLHAMERLVKRNYNNLDLVDELNKGRMKEFLTDAPTIMTKDSRPFAELIAEATETARNATYSNMPHFSLFKALTRGITKTGLTAVIAFPRFVFTSLELVSQYGAGMALPLLKRTMGLAQEGKGLKYALRKLDERDLEDISRNLVGISLAIAATIYRRKEKDRPAMFQGYIGDPHPNYKYINTSEGEAIDITPQFPLRQAMFMVEWLERYRNGTLQGSIVGNPKEAIETFAGATLRSGRTKTIFEEFYLAIGNGDEEAMNRIAKGGGTLLGTFTQRYFVPIGQIVDLERSFSKIPYINIGKNNELIDYGLKDNPRVSDIKDTSEPYKYGAAKDSFNKAFKRPFISRFGGDTDEYRNRSYVLDKDGKKRIKPFSKFLLGLSYYENNPPDSLFLEEYGFNEWTSGSKETNPQVRAFENRLMSSLIPTLSKNAQAWAKTYENENKLEAGKLPYRMNPDSPPKYSKKFIQANIRGLVTSSLSGLRSLFKEAAYAKLLDKTDFTDVGMKELSNNFIRVTTIKKLKRLPKDVREKGKQVFEFQNKRAANFESGMDMLLLYEVTNFMYKADNIFK